jgi:hypothetical protein
VSGESACQLHHPEFAAAGLYDDRQHAAKFVERSEFNRLTMETSGFCGIELRLALGHHRDVLVVQSSLKLDIKIAEFSRPRPRNSRDEEAHDHHRFPVAQCQSVCPDLAAGSRAFEGAGYPPVQFAIESELDHKAVSFVERLAPDASAKTPFAGVLTIDLRETAAMQVRQMLPVDSILIEPFQAYRHLATVGPDMRHLAHEAIRRNFHFVV